MLTIELQPLWSALGSIPQHVDREEQEPDPPLLVLPELELVLLPELLVLEPPLLLPLVVSLHSLAQFAVSQESKVIDAL